LGGFCGVAAGVAEEFGLDRYSKKIVLRRVPRPLAAGQAFTRVSREHIRQFRTAGLSLPLHPSPTASTISETWPQLYSKSLDGW